LKSRRLASGTEQTFALVFATGDEVMSGLTEFAKETGLGGARFTGIGAFSNVLLGYWNVEGRRYEEIQVREQVEVLALTGDVAVEEGEPRVHAHVVLGTRDGSARGGHLLEGHVRPTLEVMVEESPAHLRKRFDPESGLALIDPSL
jgi:predicted DNA-binding protein with PD1-like motif